MKGIGKTTTMLLLCNHLIQHGGKAYYIRCSSPQETAQPPESLLYDPISLLSVASAFSRSGGLTIVLDDGFLQCVLRLEDQGKTIITALWLAVTNLHTRVIFISSDYRLKTALITLQTDFQIHISDLYMDLPSPEQLSRLIKQRITQKHEEGKDGNEDIDIEMYCEVVGTISDVLDGYICGKDPGIQSVRDATISAFSKSLGEMEKNIGITSKTDYIWSFFLGFWTLPSLLWRQRLSSDAWYETCTAIKEVDWCSRNVASILRKMTETRSFQAADSNENSWCVWMEELDIIIYDPVTAKADFRSCVEEVAIRALLNLPVQNKEDTEKMVVEALRKR